MSECPCKECLKLAVCKQKFEVQCKDLVVYLKLRTSDCRITEVETLFKKCMTMIEHASYKIGFTADYYAYQTIIVKGKV